MTRVGVIGAIIIIVVAAIFFGFRKAAREHKTDEAATAAKSGSAATSSSTAPAETPGSAAAGSATKARPGVRRIDAATRKQLLDQITAARNRRGESVAAPPGTPSAPKELTKDYIRTQVRELIPLLTECYTKALEEDPKLAGKMVVKFAIGGEPEVGGLVEESEVDAAESTITNPGMVECVRETMYGAEFVPPADGGRVVVHYPFEFSN